MFRINKCLSDILIENYSIYAFVQICLTITWTPPSISLHRGQVLLPLCVRYPPWNVHVHQNKNNQNFRNCNLAPAESPSCCTGPPGANSIPPWGHGQGCTKPGCAPGWNTPACIMPGCTKPGWAPGWNTPEGILMPGCIKPAINSCSVSPIYCQNFLTKKARLWRPQSQNVSNSAVPPPPSGAVINHQWVMNYWTAFNEFWILPKHHLITWIQIRKSRRCLHHLPWLRHYGPLWIHHQLPCQGVWSANWPTSCNF